MRNTAEKKRKTWSSRLYSSSTAGSGVVLRLRAAAAACACLTVDAAAAAAYCRPEAAAQIRPEYCFLHNHCPNSKGFTKSFLTCLYREVAYVMQRTVWQGHSVRLCLSNAWIVTKGKKLVPIFFYHIISHPSFLTRRMVGGGDPYLLPEMLGQSNFVGAKTPIFNRYSLVAPQP